MLSIDKQVFQLEEIFAADISVEISEQESQSRASLVESVGVLSKASRADFRRRIPSFEYKKIDVCYDSESDELLNDSGSGYV